MSTETRTRAETDTFSAVETFKMVTRKIGTTGDVLSRNPNAICDFHIDVALPELNIIMLNNLAREIKFQYYIPATNELVREYTFQVGTEALEEYGPEADAPPMLDAPLPPGTHLRLAVQPIDDSDYTSRWFERLNWETCDELNAPAGLEATTYGTFTAGGKGWGVERKLRANPKFDRPVNTPKEYTR